MAKTDKQRVKVLGTGSASKAAAAILARKKKLRKALGEDVAKPPGKR